jgi:hypothetical protein
MWDTKGLALFLSLLLWLAIGAASNAAAQSSRPPLPGGAAQVYFLAIGSQDYAFTKGRSTAAQAFDPIYAPEHSARRVAEALRQAGARHGIVLTSDALGRPQQHMVTRQDVVDAIVALKARIRVDRATNPRIVFYYMGHGLGDRASRWIYAVPGNLTFDNKANQTFTLRLMKAAMSNLDVIQSWVTFRMHPSMAYLDDFFATQAMPDLTSPEDIARVIRRKKELTDRDEDNRRNHRYPAQGNPPVPFAVLFDNCYGGVAEDLVNLDTTNALFSQMLASMYRDMAGVEEDGLVLYAVRPGDRVGDFLDPEADVSAPRREGTWVGALAFRLLRALRDRDRTVALSYRAWRAAMLTDLAPGTGRQPETLPPKPFGLMSTSDEILNAPAFPPVDGMVAGTLEVRLGTGRGSVACCDIR